MKDIVLHTEKIDAEIALQKELKAYSYHSKKVTGKDMCFIKMAREYGSKHKIQGKKIWFYSWEFIGRQESGLFGSHKAPARISDISYEYPDYVDSQKIGKYTVYRLRVENIPKDILSKMKKLDFKIKENYV